MTTTDLDTLTSAVIAQIVSSYTCLKCQAPLPPTRGGHCDTCVEWRASDPLDDYEEFGQAQLDPDETPGGDPWPDGPCTNCHGPHHVQKCPEVLAALFAPYPNGAEIARDFHRNYRAYAREQVRKPLAVRYRDAALYAAYMTECLPKQRYPITVAHVMGIWDRAAARP